MIEGWPAFLGLADEAKLKALGDPAVRARLADHVAKSTNSLMGGALLRFGEYRIEVVASEKNARWVGKTAAEYAASRGVEPLEGLLLLALEEKLELSVSLPIAPGKISQTS